MIPLVYLNLYSIHSNMFRYGIDVKYRRPNFQSVFNLQPIWILQFHDPLPFVYRSRLSYEQFGAFLANVKELNAHKQTREVNFSSISSLLQFLCYINPFLYTFTFLKNHQETLRKADEIFGTENKELYAIFEGLITRNVP